MAGPGGSSAKPGSRPLGRVSLFSARTTPGNSEDTLEEEGGGGTGATVSPPRPCRPYDAGRGGEGKGRDVSLSRGTTQEKLNKDSGCFPLAAHSERGTRVLRSAEGGSASRAPLVAWTPRRTEGRPGRMLRRSSCLDGMTWDGERGPRGLLGCSPLLIKCPRPPPFGGRFVSKPVPLTSILYPVTALPPPGSPPGSPRRRDSVSRRWGRGWSLLQAGGAASCGFCVAA